MKGLFIILQVDKGINEVGKLFETNGATKPWSEFNKDFSFR